MSQIANHGLKEPSVLVKYNGQVPEPRANRISAMKPKLPLKAWQASFRFCRRADRKPASQASTGQPKEATQEAAKVAAKEAAKDAGSQTIKKAVSRPAPAR